MAAYYHHTHGTTDIPPDHLHHTLVLMNPNFPGTDYPDTHAPPPPSLPPLHHQFVRPHLESATLYGYPQPEARDVTRSRQGLSLSLSSQTPPYGPHHDVAGGGVLGSKYLKATQELLEEVVHVGDGLLSKSTECPKKSGGGGGDGGSGGDAQLSSAEKQELQMRKAKLINMLDEAEQRYRQYHSQIQIVITWFDQASGIGSSKTYTALALKTISKQFRCLKDAIQAQVKAASKSLGEGGESGSSAGKIEGSRLKYIDHQIRQQRAMQQFGMIQNHNAWRPQRGLPERSVSVLRAWLFEHFLHPYPKDSDKTMLAKQAGLTRSQVSNWFINARVRLWKPMIEEMYTEENKEKEQNLSEDKTSSKENSIESNSATDHEKKINISNQNQAKGGTLKDQNPALSSSSSSYSPSFIPIPIPTPPFKGNTHTLPQNQHGFAFTGLLEMEGISQGSPKRPRNNQVLHCSESNREILIKFGNDKQGKDNGYPMIPGSMNFVGGGEELESYPTIGEIGRFGTEEFPPTTRFLPGNGISLSLGLPPSENHTFLSPNHDIQFRRANDFGSLLNCCQTL